MLEQLTAQAFSLGFARMAVLPPEGTPVEHTHPHNRQLVEGPQRILPGAKALLLLVWPYRPYRRPPTPPTRPPGPWRNGSGNRATPRTCGRFCA